MDEVVECIEGARNLPVKRVVEFYGVLSFNGDREALVHLYVERHLIVGTLLMGKTDEERMLIHFVVISRIFKGRVKGMIALRGAAGSMSDLYMVSKIKKK